MPRSKTPKFDASQAITNELIRIIERGVLPWRQPWTIAGSGQPLRHTGEPYQGINNFLLTARTMMAGYASPYWMTFQQAKAYDASVRKGEKSSLVVFYGQSRKNNDEAQSNDGDDDVNAGSVLRFQKSYRVFNADQIDGFPEKFTPKPSERQTHQAHQPVPHMQAFFDAIEAQVSYTGRQACYVPALDKIYMPEISLFDNPLEFYGVLAHEFGHWTKPRYRLNRDYGSPRFGNTAYAREEIVAELCSVFVGQHLGFTSHTLEMNAAYLDNWLRVLRSDKNAIFKHAADAQRACDYLIAASTAGRSATVPQAA